MSAKSAYLAVTPEKCDGCSRCVRACPKGLLRVGGGYIYVDTSACDGCMACVETCDRGAIARRTVPARPTVHGPHLAPGEVPKVVVGSRAEAKSLRKAAETAQRDRVSAAKTAEKSRTRAVVRAEAGAVTGAVQWTNLDVIAVLAVLVALLVGKEAALGSQFVSIMPAAGQTAARAVVMIVFYGVLATALAFLSHRHGCTLVEAFGLRGRQTTARYRATTAGLVVALLIATRVVAMGWGAFAQAIGWQPPARAELTDVFGAGGVGLVLAGLVVVAIGPFVEELVFRGLVLPGATSRFALWPAISISAGLFALSHTTAWTLVPLFVLGMAAGWLAVDRHSLWAAISLHAAYNGVVVAAAFWLVS